MTAALPPPPPSPAAARLLLAVLRSTFAATVALLRGAGMNGRVRGGVARGRCGREGGLRSTRMLIAPLAVRTLPFVPAPAATATTPT